MHTLHVGTVFAVFLLKAYLWRCGLVSMAIRAAGGRVPGSRGGK